MKTKELYFYICNILKKAGIADFIFEADCILADICGIDRETRIMHPDQIIDENKISLAEKCIKKRSKHYPLQYLLGNWEFYGRTFAVGKGVLIPRQDTEILAETAVSFLADIPEKTDAMDLFGGSGCVAVTIAKEIENSRVYSVEYEKNAYKYLCKNSEKYGSCVNTMFGDATDFRIASDFENYFDVITANPPYLTAEDMKNRQTELKFEPQSALYGGRDGLYFYRRIIPLWKNSLKTNGLFAVEIGAEQGEDVADLFRNYGYYDVIIKKDFAGLDRVVCGRKK